MIYNQLNLQDNSFTNQAVGSTPKIIVEYNGRGIHTIAGPVPVVDISYGFNNNSNNLAESLTTTINLNGKILRWPEGQNIAGVDADKAIPGFSGIMAGISGLKSLFSECPYGTLVFKCGTNILHEISGVRVTNLQFDNTEDNWAQTANYSVSLEASERLWEGSGDDAIEKYVTDRSDSWNIEPLDDSTYVSFDKQITTKYEHSNPKLGRPSNFGPNNPNPGTEKNTISILNVPQFRITRRLSAKGSVAKIDRICQSGMSEANSKPYVFAKAWVENMSRKAFRSSSPSNNSSPYFKNPFNNNLFAFNHNRTVNIDIFNGTYETNDTWLAMPSGIPYTETYSIETSTSEDYIRTVRIAGNIIGLSITNQGLMSDSGVLPTGTGNNSVIDAELKLNNYISSGQGSSSSYGALDAHSSNTSVPAQQNIATDKYNNALNAWSNHIKPYLYRRASLVINSSDRSLDYLPTTRTKPPQIPNNPIYSRESLLSTIPINSSEGHDPRKGTISYSYEFNNKLNIISGVVSENITVNYENPTDSTSETQVIGRALGPIIQRVGRTSPKKTINVEIAIPAVSDIDQISLNHTSCPMHKDGHFFKTIEKIIEAHRPYSPSTFLNEPVQTEGLVYTSNDSEQWSPTAGKYSRSVSWVYQQASLNKDFRDH